MSSHDQQHDLAAKLIGELRDLSAPNLQAVLQEFVLHSDIGPALRRLASGVSSVTETPSETDAKPIWAIPLQAQTMPDLENAKRESNEQLNDANVFVRQIATLGTELQASRELRSHLLSINNCLEQLIVKLESYGQKRELVGILNQVKDFF